MKRIVRISALLACMAATTVSAGEQKEPMISDDFIAGFIAGAQMTDGEIITRLNAEGEKRSDFFERAFKTRVGERSEPVPATYYAGFCIPDDAEAGQVVKTVKLEVETLRQQNEPGGAELVYKALRSRYPC